MNKPLKRLKHHVTGAIERGEKQAIVAIVEESKDEIKLNKILTNFDLIRGGNSWNYLLKEGLAMRAMGYTWLEIEAMLDAKLELLPLNEF